ncbi:sulfatase-like hydrolase/transferase [Myxococcota bacterium]|nr:sulfatase-like hydrolase/transferase [Myxococcota bacterium]
MRRHDRLFIAAALLGALHLGYTAWVNQIAPTGAVEVLSDEAMIAEDLAGLRGKLSAMRPLPPKAGPDVVLIVVNGARADLWDDATPEVSAWAEGAARHTNARAAAVEPTPALMTLLTGLLPSEHGLYREAAGLTRASPASVETLPQRLSAAGYRTIQLTATRGERPAGQDRGFDLRFGAQLSEANDRLPYQSAERMAPLVESALAWPREAPLFLQVSLDDPLLPWAPRSPYVTDPDALLPQVMPLKRDGRQRRGFEERRLGLLNGDLIAEPEELLAWRAAVSAELRYLDDQLGDLLRRLPSLGVGEDDYVIVVGACGQALGEDGALGEGRSLAEGSLRVPLLVRGPGVTPGEDRAPISTRGLAAWLLDKLGLPPLPPSRVAAAEAASPPAHFAERLGRLPQDVSGRVTGPSPHQRAVTQGSRKLLLDETGRPILCVFEAQGERCHDGDDPTLRALLDAVSAP